MAGRVANRWISRAFRWQKFALIVFAFWVVISIACGFDAGLANFRIIQSIQIVLSLLFTLSVVTVGFYIYRGSVRFRGSLYSTAHVFLLIVLTPAFLVGLLFIPTLVNGDMIRLRDGRRNNGK